MKITATTCFKAFVRQHEPTDVGKVAKAFGGIIVRNSALLARSHYKTINELNKLQILITSSNEWRNLTRLTN